MRIGFVLFGHLRSYKDAYFSFENLRNALAKEFELDIFCHTWDVKESLSPAWWKTNEKSDEQPAYVDESEFTSMYSPVRYEIEKSRQFEEPQLGIRSQIPLAGMCSMLYSQIRSFELLKKHEEETGKQYDVVIKGRYDLLYELTNDFTNMIPSAVQNDCIYLPSSNPYELAGAYSDVFAIGERRQIESYFSFNNNIEEAAQIYKQNQYREMIPELLMSVYLKNKNAKIGTISGLRITILRTNGAKFSVNSDKNFEDNSPLCFFLPSVEKCISFLPPGSDLIKANGEKFAKKYLSWILQDEYEVDQYASFNRGKWIPLQKISSLIDVNKQQKIFAAHVLRDFFELSLWNAKYSLFKKLLVAAVLATRGGYGLLYFNSIKKQKFG